MRTGTVVAVGLIGLSAWFLVERYTALGALEPLRMEAVLAVEPAPAQQPAVEADVFHPAHQPGADGRRPPLPEPAYGGRAVVRRER